MPDQSSVRNIFSCRILHWGFWELFFGSAVFNISNAICQCGVLQATILYPCSVNRLFFLVTMRTFLLSQKQIMRTSTFWPNTSNCCKILQFHCRSFHFYEFDLQTSNLSSITIALLQQVQNNAVFCTNRTPLNSYCGFSFKADWR